MAMNPEDIIKGLAAFAAGGTLDQGKRFLLTESAALLKFQQYRVYEAERKQGDAQHALTEIKALNEALQLRMAGMLAVQDHFRQQLLHMAALRLAPGEAA